MLKVVVAAAALSFMICVGASALPAPKSQIIMPSSDLIQVGKKYHDKHSKHYDKHYKAYKHGYKHAPKGWKSYSYRPMLWERRGCIVIGPAWYCP